MNRDRLRRIAIRRAINKTAAELGAPLPHTHPGREVARAMSPSAHATHNALWALYRDALEAEAYRIQAARFGGAA